MKAFLTISIFLLGSICHQPSLFAQRVCATETYRDLQQEKGKKVSNRVFEEWLAEKKLRSTLRTLGTKEDPALIPVVVHVIHNGELLGNGGNISEQQIISQIEVLNEDFQRMNADTILTPSDFLPFASSLNIEFVLAKRDPLGNPSNGIVRKQGSQTQWSPFADDVSLKSESYWQAEDYLNIWVCDLTGLNLGYAQFPDIDLGGLENENNENRLTDGVVMDYETFGSNEKGDFDNLRAPYDKGRTTTHEVGHWLGLLHTFATPGSCSSDDYVDDTPLQRNDYNGSCPTHPSVSCSSADMFQNFMDYTNDECMNIFTAGQTGRMQTVFDFALRRGSLLNAIGAFPVEEDYYDIKIVSIDKPTMVSCVEEINPVITLQNAGTEPIDRVVVEYGLDNQIQRSDTLELDSLQSGQQILVSLNSLPVEAGAFEFTANFRLVNEIDNNPTNDDGRKAFIINRDRDFIPYLQSWNSPDIYRTNWTAFSPGDDKTWETTTSLDGRQTAFINYHNYPDVGEVDWLVSPVLDFSSAERATLRFDLSYARFRRHSDTLAVYVSTDCGESYEQIYLSSGENMSVLDFNDAWSPETEDDWKEITVGLNKYAGMSDVRVAFKGINDYGNNLYLDEIEFFVQSSGEIVVPPEQEIVVFPNPVDDHIVRIAINAENRNNRTLSIYDTRGSVIYRSVMTNALNQTFTIDLTGRSPGVYIVKVESQDFTDIKKIIYQP